MSIQSDAAKAHIEKLLDAEYETETIEGIVFGTPFQKWFKEYQFAKPRRWAFDYAVPHLLCANHGSGLFCQETSSINTTFNVLLP